MIARFGNRFWTRRRAGLVGVLGCAACAAYALWQPGLSVRDGHDDRKRNALWLGHGWLGADSWFDANHKSRSAFRTPAAVQNLAQLCRQNHITDLYAHLCPANPDGSIAAANDSQIEGLLDNTPDLRVLPWIGGRLDAARPVTQGPQRMAFLHSVRVLFQRHPRLAGIHLNIEPWNSGDSEALKLLDGLRQALPPGKIISVSAYPPADWFYPFRRGWSPDYFKQVAVRTDQMALMSYDTSVHSPKLYEWFQARWTREALQFTQDLPHPPQILAGVPTYGAAGPRWGAFYHNPRVETLNHALRGVHAGLATFPSWPANYQGVAVYCEWETDAGEWRTWRDAFACAQPVR